MPRPVFFVTRLLCCALAFAVALNLCWPAAAVAGGARAAFVWPVVHPPGKPDWPVVYPDDSISILLAGDTGFGGHHQPVRDGFGMRHGRKIPYAKMTQGIADLLTGDAAFANIETVVTDHNRLRPAGKRFVFRSHASSLRHLHDRGFNLFSTSNNHVGDYGRSGIRETLDHLAALRREGRAFAAAGLGRNRADAVAPKKLRIKNANLYLSAVGIGGGTTNRRGRSGVPGHLHYRTESDFADAVAALSALDDGYRMLSVHYGEEGQIYPSHRDILRLRDRAVRQADIDLIIGHHAHVARGIARVDGKLIFYGLGNFMHPGMQDMARFNRCRDFGLVARVHLGRTGPSTYSAMAVEAIPITGMHATPRVMAPSQARKRIGVLNGLARGLDSPRHESQGVRFRALPDGRGVACFPGADQMRGEIARLCAAGGDRAGASPQGNTTMAAEPAISCGGSGFRGAGYRGGYKAKRRKYSKRRKSRRKKADYFNPFAY